MRLDDQRASDNVDDQRGAGSGGFGGGGGSSGFGGGGGGGIGGAAGLLPLLLSTIGFRGMLVLAILYFGLKFTTGIDLVNILNGGGISMPGGTSQIQFPTGGSSTQAGPPGSKIADSSTGSSNVAATDSGKLFVAKVLGSTEDVWGSVFQSMGKQYEQPRLVLFSGYTQSGCGTAKSASGPFYCPNDHKVYIDLAFYQDMKDKLGAPGDFAQAYVVAHEVGHHVQTLLGISDQVEAARSRVSETDSNALSVRTELQADCFAGYWATQADASKHILQSGDIEEALNAASQIGDDRLQKQAQGYAVPDSFTHGTSAQRVKWFKQGLVARVIPQDCDTFNADPL